MCYKKTAKIAEKAVALLWVTAFSEIRSTLRCYAYSAIGLIVRLSLSPIIISLIEVIPATFAAEMTNFRSYSGILRPRAILLGFILIQGRLGPTIGHSMRH